MAVAVELGELLGHVVQELADQVRQQLCFWARNSAFIVYGLWLGLTG